MDARRVALSPPADSRSGLARLRAERPGWMRSLSALRRRRDPRAATLVLALDPVLVLDERFEAHGALLEDALRIAPDAGPRVHAGLLRAHARIWTLRGGHRIARRAFLEARQIASGAVLHEEPVGEALITLGCTQVAFGLGLVEEVARETRDLAALAAAATGTSAALRIRALSSQASGFSAWSRGASAEAIEHFQEAIDWARRAGADRTLAIGLANRGFALRDHGELQRAESSLLESLALFRSLGDLLHTTLVEGSLRVLSPPGAPLDVAGVLGAAAACERLGDARSAAGLLLTLIERERRAGPDPRPSTWLEHVWSLLARIDAPALEARARRLTETWGPVAPGPAEGRLLEVQAGGALATFGGATLDLRSRRALPRVLLALARARVESEGAYLSVQDLFAAGWPGEKALEHAASARVYMAVRALRTMGLRGALATTPAGYRIEPEVEVHLLPATRKARETAPGAPARAAFRDI